jgi:hypothetical protein
METVITKTATSANSLFLVIVIRFQPQSHCCDKLFIAERLARLVVRFELAFIPISKKPKSASESLTRR